MAPGHSFATRSAPEAASCGPSRSPSLKRWNVGHERYRIALRIRSSHRHSETTPAPITSPLRAQEERNRRGRDWRFYKAPSCRVSTFVRRPSSLERLRRDIHLDPSESFPAFWLRSRLATVQPTLAGLRGVNQGGVSCCQYLAAPLSPPPVQG